jgi:hypothetical protein
MEMQKTPEELINTFYENEENFIVNEAVKILASTTEDSLKLRALELLEKIR